MKEIAPANGTSDEVTQPDSSQIRLIAAGGASWTVAGALTQAVLQVSVLVILARLLTPSDFGQMSLALMMMGFFTILSEFGIGRAIVQHPNLETHHLRSGLSLLLISGVISAVIVYVTAPLISTFFEQVELAIVLRALTPAFLLGAVEIYADSLLQRSYSFRKVAVVRLVAFASGGAVAASVLAFLGVGVWALVGGYLVQSLIRAVLLMRLVPMHRFGFPDRKASADILMFASGQTAARLATFVADKADTFVVGHALGAGALGLYDRAYRLMELPAQYYGMALERVLFSVSSRIQTERKRLARAYQRGLGLNMLILLPLSFILCIAAPELIVALLGPAWSGTVEPFQVLALFIAFRNGYKVNSMVARACGKVYRLAWRHAIYAVLVIVGAGVAVRFGLRGVAAAVALGILSHYIHTLQLNVSLGLASWREIVQLHLPAVGTAACAAAATAIAAVITRGNHFVPFSSLPIMLLAGFAAMVLAMRFLPGPFISRDSLEWIISMANDLIRRMGINRARAAEKMTP